MSTILTTEYVPPYDDQWLMAEKMMGGRVTISANDVEECRAHFMGIAASVRASLPEPTAAVKTEDVEISPSHRVRIYIPTAAGDSLPVGLYIHSGGWYTGSIETEDFLCHMIAEQSQIILFSPEYRLAPENPYPAGLEDCCKAYEFMHAVASNYGGNPKKSFIMGGSAGGNLAACVALKYVSNAKLKLSGLIVACMVSCDPKALPGEYKKKYSSMGYRGTPLIDDISVQNARVWYNAPHPDDPLYSPLLHPDIKLLPRVYVTAATHDPTYQETVFFFQECKKQGVRVDMKEWVGMPHFFWSIPSLPKSTEFMAAWNEKLRGMIVEAS